MSDTLLWISGASSGIGAALAQTVPYPDAHVIDISRSGGTPGTEHVPADMADPASWSAIAAHFLARLADFGGARVGFVHAAAALAPIGFAGEVDHTSYRRTVLLNTAAPQVLGDAFLQALRASGFDGAADLIFLSSGAATKPSEGWSAYCAGKAAQDMWVRAVGAEQVRRGHRARVLAIAPGVVATGMQELIRNTDERDFPSVGRFHRLYENDELANPLDSAQRIWDIVASDLQSGAVVDVRAGA